MMDMCSRGIVHRMLYASVETIFLLIALKPLLSFAAIIAVLVLFGSPVAASSTCLDGEMIIQPFSVCRLPLMSSNSSTFTILVNGSAVGTFPNVLLVMTRDCFEGLKGPVLVNWTNGWTSFFKINFWETSAGYVPPETVTDSDNGRYNVTDLRECLDGNSMGGSTLYYVWGAFLGGQTIGQSPQTFTVTLPSTQPRMLVLALAQTPCARFFNMRVVPVQPGDIIPELNPLLLIAALTALLVYASKRTKTYRSGPV